VEGYTKSGAREYARHGIRINAVAPGLVHTEMTADFIDAADNKTSAHRGRYPIGRFAEAGDIVGAVLFLASDQSEYVNGVSLPVDGGYLTG
jgi:NAD(P)-dependent dehydrogenase (short-subunit alcohol dehydrogenase family)